MSKLENFKNVLTPVFAQQNYCNQDVDKRMSFVAKLSNDVTVKYHLEDKCLSHCKNAKHVLTFWIEKSEKNLQIIPNEKVEKLNNFKVQTNQGKMSHFQNCLTDDDTFKREANDLAWKTDENKHFEYKHF